jgi:hypothetical protein
MMAHCVVRDMCASQHQWGRGVTESEEFLNMRGGKRRMAVLTFSAPESCRPRTILDGLAFQVMAIADSSHSFRLG